ncbi:MAG: DUF599 domain-containing protein [Pseudomonadales bacterium]|nr:DUF599 domain-containing protein [Pseudomonadales bacterium]
MSPHPSLLLGWPDLVAFSYMIIIWIAYAQYARHRAKRGDKQSLSHSMRLHRITWVSQMLARDVRVTDAALLASQERVVGFFASATLILLAAVFTAVSSSGQIAALTGELPLSVVQSDAQIQTKLILIAVMLIYAFFMITWSLRQYGFAAVLMGAAPMPGDELQEAERQRYVEQLARLMDGAGHDNNAGLRAYYFCLAMIFWVLNPWVYAAATTLIIAVLARREFKSKTVKTLEGFF